VIDATVRRIAVAPQLEAVLRVRASSSSSSSSLSAAPQNNLLAFLAPDHPLRPVFEHRLELAKRETPPKVQQAAISYDSSSDDDDQEEDDEEEEQKEDDDEDEQKEETDSSDGDQPDCDQQPPDDVLTVMRASAATASSMPQSLGLRILLSSAKACGVDVGQVTSSDWLHHDAWQRCLARHRQGGKSHLAQAGASEPDPSAASEPDPSAASEPDPSAASEPDPSAASAGWTGYDLPSLDGDDSDAQAARATWRRDNAAVSGNSGRPSLADTSTFLTKPAVELERKAHAFAAVAGRAFAGDEAELIVAGLAAAEAKTRHVPRARQRYAERVLGASSASASAGSGRVVGACGAEQPAGLSASAMERLRAAREAQRQKRTREVNAAASASASEGPEGKRMVQ
jgi:hypothetical protein